MRGNGLPAAHFVAIADLDPQLADAMLEVLRDEGVAAYAAPVSDHRPLTELPARTVNRPLDRLYVDREASDRARAVVESRLPGLRDDYESGAVDTSAVTRDRLARDPAAAGPVRDDDAVWADIVAQFDRTPDDTEAQWPEAENLDDERNASSFDLTRSLRPAQERVEPPAPELADVPEEHFVPPPPPPLPKADVVTRWAWIALLGGPLLLLIAALTGFDVRGWPGLLAVGGFVGGFVTLVARMKDRPPTDTDPDDGAVV
jgi:hypothetical protein